MSEPDPKSFEKLGGFYLGRGYDPEKQASTGDLLLYDAKDLTTHAVCVGMTGSGKTGLCISLLEEAAIDGVPALVIDPKGDLGNLMLTFPELRPQDFRPWIDESEAARKNQTPDALAEATATRWRDGLAQWGQDGDRIARLKAAADVSIYTPGSSAGIPLRVLKSFAAPPETVRTDSELLRERIGATAAGLLGLLGIDADPVRSREQILLSNLLEHAWTAGEDLDLPRLIHKIQKPPFEKVGVMDLETFFPSSDRVALSMQINNLLASPNFASWLEGEPLSIPHLLWTPSGKPRISILSIAHLPQAERMFFVTLVLNELITWMRGQPGTSSLRALLYMDEVFGFLPPTENPPSKKPMLTLLKQARAYGVGLTLATQNPVDLDYKALSNAGTWFLGRLQTERDQARVLDGLEGAASANGQAWDRKKMETLLSGIKGRVFVLNNVHEDAPTVFHTRWAMSYLRGPLTRAQIKTLMDPIKHERISDTAPSPTPPAQTSRPVIPPDVPQLFAPETKSAAPETRLVYRPRLFGTAKLHFVQARSGLDRWETVSVWAPLNQPVPTDPWESAAPASTPASDLDSEGDDGAQFDPVPTKATRSRSYSAWNKKLGLHLYRNQGVTVWRCAKLKENSRPEETEGEFRARLVHHGREKRDQNLEKLRKKYGPKLARLQEKIRTAEGRVEKEQDQYQQQKMNTALSVGATVLGALFGRKLASVGTVGRATSAARGAGRIAREKGDIARAEEKLQSLREQLEALEEKFADETAELQTEIEPSDFELEARTVRPRKSDISVSQVALVWTPWRVNPQGIAEQSF